MAPKALDLGILRNELKDAGSPWQMTETSMTKLNEADRRVRLGFNPPSGEMTLEEAALSFEQDLTAAVTPASNIGAPSKIDHRNLNGKDYTTPVKNQGACGSCVAFGTVAVMETTYKRKMNQPNLDLDLSEAHMFYCHARSEGRRCSNGWWPENAFKKARDIGVTADHNYPYTAGDQDCSGLQSDWQQELAKVTGFTKQSSSGAMKNWLANHGSITGCFVVYQDFFSYGSGVYKHVTGSSAGGHCVEIIGYDDSLGAWICKNSWGTGWGDNGYFMIGYGQCNIENWSGPWGLTGVTLRRWHHNVNIAGLWTNTADLNTHAYLAGVGWRRICNDGRTQHMTMLTQLAFAKSAGHKVSVLDDANEIRQIYA